MVNNQEKLLRYLKQIETLASDILVDKNEIVMLDKRRNKNREALRDLTKSSQKKYWLTVGSILVKHKFEDTKTLLEADQKQLNIDINKLRSDLKIKVNTLRDLEMQPPVPGLMLVPLSQKETEGLTKSNLFSL
ncbi:p53 and DNA damage-regulated protein 1 [Bombyx mandarina]|uniref:P53 and DNA damage-regulated protein 1 n=1 Tax=Bombyx mandarina TaxID=7092 RepID=A0A6J2K8U8_BOMMA|nr:p53 and DNA damage-regulated protein 1 [Bombyx mandarina]